MRQLRAFLTTYAIYVRAVGLVGLWFIISFLLTRPATEELSFFGFFLLFVMLYVAGSANALLLQLFLRTKRYTGEYREQLMALAKAQGLPLHDIHVWPTSQVNALATGLGRFRRVTFTSTVLETYPIEALTAVFMHELGHHQNNDPKRYRFWLAVTLPILVAVNRWLYHALNLTNQFQLALICVGTTIIFTVIASAYSRKREHYADTYVLEHHPKPEDLAQFFKKVVAGYREKGSIIPNPPPLWLKLLSTHPWTSERIKRLG